MSQKTQQRLSVYDNFGTIITRTIGHRQVFLFSHLTYLVQLLYLGKLTQTAVKVKQNHENFTGICNSDQKSLSVKGVYRPSTCAFIFPPHLFSAATLPWETVET